MLCTKDYLMTSISHPPVLCSAIIARSDTGPGTLSPIANIALFTAMVSAGQPPQFTLAKAAVDPGTSQAAVIAALCQQIPHGAQVLVQELREDAAFGLQPCDPEDLPNADNDLFTCFLHHAELVPFAVDDAQLASVGRGIGLAMPGLFTAPAERSRFAPQNAMAMWATYTVGFCSEEEAASLLAAFRAWHLAEGQRGAGW